MADSAAPDALLTPAEVAALFRVNPKTVTRWAAAGRISSIRTPGGHRPRVEGPAAMTSLRYSEVEEELRAAVRGLLRDRAPWPAVLARTEGGEPVDRPLWRMLAADMGVAGLAVPERLGGAGASWREMASQEERFPVIPINGVDTG